MKVVKRPTPASVTAKWLRTKSCSEVLIRPFTTLFTRVILTFGLSSAAVLQAAPGTGAYKVDSSKSELSFEVGNFLVLKVKGRFTQFSGQVTIASTFESSSVEASANTTSVDTGNDSRDEHLRTDDFFDVPHFPVMTFRSTAIQGTADKFSMKGILTIRGQSKEVSFECRLTEDKLGFVAETSINRHDFKVSDGSTIKDTVHLTLTIYLKS